MQKMSGITYKQEKKKIPEAIPMLKEDHQALGLFVSKCTNKNAAFHYPLTMYFLAIAVPWNTISITNKPIIQKWACQVIKWFDLKKST